MSQQYTINGHTVQGANFHAALESYVLSTQNVASQPEKLNTHGRLMIHNGVFTVKRTSPSPSHIVGGGITKSKKKELNEYEGKVPWAKFEKKVTEDITNAIDNVSSQVTLEVKPQVTMKLDEPTIFLGRNEIRPDNVVYDENNEPVAVIDAKYYEKSSLQVKEVVKLVEDVMETGAKVGVLIVNENIKISKLAKETIDLNENIKVVKAGSSDYENQLEQTLIESKTKTKCPEFKLYKKRTRSSSNTPTHQQTPSNTNAVDDKQYVTLKQYKGGQILPGGKKRAPAGGCWYNKDTKKYYVNNKRCDENTLPDVKFKKRSKPMATRTVKNANKTNTTQKKTNGVNNANSAHSHAHHNKNNNHIRNTNANNSHASRVHRGANICHSNNNNAVNSRRELHVSEGSNLSKNNVTNSNNSQASHGNKTLQKRVEKMIHGMENDPSFLSAEKAQECIDIINSANQCGVIDNSRRNRYTNEVESYKTTVSSLGNFREINIMNNLNNNAPSNNYRPPNTRTSNYVNSSRSSYTNPSNNSGYRRQNVSSSRSQPYYNNYHTGYSGYSSYNGGSSGYSSYSGGSSGSSSSSSGGGTKYYKGGQFIPGPKGSRAPKGGGWY